VPYEAEVESYPAGVNKEYAEMRFPEPLAKLKIRGHPRESGGPEGFEETGFPLPRE
jgi:hypothetical protein